MGGPESMYTLKIFNLQGRMVYVETVTGEIHELSGALISQGDSTVELQQTNGRRSVRRLLSQK